MTSKSPFLFVTLLIASLIGGTAAFADPPPTTVQIDYRLDPNDSQSAVLFSVSLHLSPASINGNEVGWEITASEFYQPGTDREWTTASLSVIGARTGLWWITHADPNSPVASEFTSIPHLSGMADCTEPQEPDLFFEMAQGTTDLEPEEYPFGSKTGFSDHSFLVDGETEPDEEGEDEPVDVGTT